MVHASGLIMRRQQAMQQARQQAIQRAMIMRQQQQRALAGRVNPAQKVNVNYKGAYTVFDLSQVWRELVITSEIWLDILDQDPKEQTVSVFIREFQKKGAIIRKSPAMYVAMIDSMLRGNPNFKRQPFQEVLKIAAIVEYDFDNGQNKDQMALSVLGQAGYEKNKQRLGL